MTELFTEQAQFAKANNWVKIDGKFYDEAKAQREFKESIVYKVNRGQNPFGTDSQFALYLLRKVFVKKNVNIEGDGRNKTANGLNLSELESVIANTKDFKEEKEATDAWLTIWMSIFNDKVARNAAKGRKQNPGKTTPFGFDDDVESNIEGENIIEFAEDENNNEEITVTRGNKNSLLWRINPELSMETEKVYTASFSGFDNDFAENPDVSEQFNEFIDFVKDEVEKYVEDTAIIKSERMREQRDLEAKPSWMSQELYDLLE